MRIVALIASVVVVVQMVVTLVSGSSICPTAGCRVVEDLTVIPPLLLNILGLLFFQTVFWSTKKLPDKSIYGIDPTGLLLLGGMAFDSVLLAYQIFVAHAFCGYCLVIFSLVLLLNLLHGRRQAVLSVAVLAAVLVSFSTLSFVPGGSVSQAFSLKKAAYGVKSCSTPTKEIYLIFSSTCPHCQKVIQSLNECNSCDLYLNPIDEIKALDLVDIELNEDFSPRINRHILAILGIETIPVLVSKGPDSYSIIKGEENILNYIRHACFTADDVLYLDKTISTGDDDITVFKEEAGECSLTIDCAEGESTE